MKIIHIVLSLEIGGLENLVCDMARLQSRDNEVILCSLERKNGLPRSVKENGFRIVYLDRKEGKDFRLFFELQTFLRRERPDIVHTHNSVPLVYGALAGSFTKVPVLINTRHGEGVTRKPGFFWNAHNYVVTISHSARHRLLGHNNIDMDKIRVIHNGIDADRFNGSMEKTVKSDKNGKHIVGTVARLDHYKDIPNLISGFKKVVASFEGAELWIVGDGPLKAYLEARVNAEYLKDSVKFWGWQENVTSINKDMSVFVLPSLTEGISIALLEAMACKVPVVATHVGGNPEVVMDGVTGFLVPPKNPEKLADAIIKILSDKELRKKMASEGRKRAKEKFSLKRMVAEYQGLYNEGLNNHKSLSK